MAALSHLNADPHRNNEQRLVLRHFVEIKIRGNVVADKINAMTTSYNDRGLGILSPMSLPVGTQVEINEDGHCIAVGKVIKSNEWYNHELFHIGIILTETNNYWMPFER